MTDRYVALAIAARAAAPPGVDGEAFRRAVTEDTYEVIADLELVTPAVHRSVADLTWPGTVLFDATTPRSIFAELQGLGAGQAAIVAPDAPDLPGLLVGKLFRALGRAEAAVCAAAGGGLVALAAALPLAPWLEDLLGDREFDTPAALDTPDALDLLRAAAPGPGAVRTGPGWHRLRAPGDITLLDPGLEGWENTRALLTPRAPHHH